MWDRLGSEVQLLVVGGGINGAGIARDAARRGLTVALVERGDLAEGTSSRSSKLVHGGLRYLEQYEFGLVFEAVSERRILMDIAPHMVNPLGFVFPVYEGDRRSLATIRAGMMLYDGLSLFRSPKRHRMLSPTDIEEIEPALTTEKLKGAPLYYDCSTDDARLTLENVLDAADHGAVIATHADVTGFIRDEHGRIAGASVRDTLTGTTKEVFAGAVINATGPWTDQILRMASGEEEQAAMLRPTKGVHIVVRYDRLPVTNAVVCFHPDDGRVLFAIPWGDCTYIGTTDTDFEGDPADVYADTDDVEYLLRASAAYFPDAALGRDDVLCTWAGLRPLVRAPASDGEMDESAVSREHRIDVGHDGLVTVTGGKLTTYRLMSNETVDKAVKVLRLGGKLDRPLKNPVTDQEPLPGAVRWPDDDDHDAVAAEIREVGGQAVSEETARLLADTYGMRGREVARLVRLDAALGEALVPGRPEILAQVDWAVEQEFSASVESVLKQRTQIYYRDPQQGLGCARSVSERMATLLGWSDAQRKASVAAYEAEVAASRRWRNG
ncbi:MAG: glycerol-3-phosphate dehydrogenase [Proteobacteria bacterium]|nr:glycerol-3-phosphate dehydrogenase [Pseudomonadota bacterium]